MVPKIEQSVDLNFKRAESLGAEGLRFGVPLRAQIGATPDPALESSGALLKEYCESIIMLQSPLITIIPIIIR